MSEIVYLSVIRKKIISAKKIESLTLLSVTVRCGDRSSTFFIDPALADIVLFFYLNCFGVVEQMLTSPSVSIPYGPDAAVYDNDFNAIIPILITDFTSELPDTDEKLNSVKFTWRLAETRPIVRLSASPGIFTSPYNIVYS